MSIKKKILLHYPFIPSYRVPIFNLLSLSNNFDFVFMSDLEDKNTGIFISKDDWDFKHIKSKLVSFNFLSKKLEFEFGVFSYLFKNRKSLDYYVVLSNPNILSSWLYPIIAKILGIKVIFWTHGLLKEDKGLKNFIRFLYYKIPCKFWLYGNRAKTILNNKYSVSLDSMYVIYNSLDYTKQSYFRNLFLPNRESIRSELGYKSDDFVLVCIGRLLKKLKIELVIKALSVCNQVNLKLIIIGDGPEKVSLEKTVNVLGVSDSVHFAGALYNEEHIGKYYTAADASVVMGVVGLSAMHSLSYGVPMITHSSIEEHCPEIEAIIPNFTGEFFIKDNIDSFIEALLKINKSNRSYRNSCIEIIENFYTPEKQLQYISDSLNA